MFIHWEKIWQSKEIGPIHYKEILINITLKSSSYYPTISVPLICKYVVHPLGILIIWHNEKILKSWLLYKTVLIKNQGTHLRKTHWLNYLSWFNLTRWVWLIFGGSLIPDYCHFLQYVRPKVCQKNTFILPSGPKEMFVTSVGLHLEW